MESDILTLNLYLNQNIGIYNSTPIITFQDYILYTHLYTSKLTTTLIM